MNFFSGSQLAAAIEDLATLELTQAELILSERIVAQLCSHLPLHSEEIPKKLINGFMRGSTAFNDEQIADEIYRLQRQSTDRQDPMLIVGIIKNSLERERKEIHIRRTQKSAVRQILRAVKDDLENTVTTKPSMVSSFMRSQQDLLTQEIASSEATYIWADRVLELYTDLFVDVNNSLTDTNFKPKGIVSRLAANNYGNAWMRFVKEHMTQLYEKAQVSKPIATTSLMESAFGSDFNLNRTNYNQPPKQGESIRVVIENSGQGAVKFEKTWSSKSDAKAGMNAFFALLTTLVDPNERLDLVEISIESTNGISLSLQEVTQDKIKETLDKLLSA